MMSTGRPRRIDAATRASLAVLAGGFDWGEPGRCAACYDDRLAPATTLLDCVLALNASGRIPVDGEMRTSVPGVFAAGTVRSGSIGRAVSSAGDGATAALSADRYLRGL
jgi:NADPH-dependent 2,4-dienoyl-CoA reductase/sulfur reductase-like enzyme